MIKILLVYILDTLSISKNILKYRIWICDTNWSIDEQYMWYEI